MKLLKSIAITTALILMGIGAGNLPFVWNEPAFYTVMLPLFFTATVAFVFIDLAAPVQEKHFYTVTFIDVWQRESTQTVEAVSKQEVARKLMAKRSQVQIISIERSYIA